MKKKRDINKIRKSIDRLDAKILALLSRRGHLAQGIGRLKKHSGRHVYTPAREKRIFDRLAGRNSGPYQGQAIRAIFREIISATRALEEPIKVAFLGPEATFTHEAAVQHFGSSAQFLPQNDINGVFRQVETKCADFGVVPIENSTEGVVNYTLDKFVLSNLKICSEIIISVALNLLSTCQDFSRIKKVYSHPHALSQCRRWLALNLPRVELHHAESTAAAARTVARLKGAAAIAGSFAADYYGLGIVAANIHDQVNNLTRFLVLGHNQSERTNHDKTSIAFVARDKPGILYHLLQPLARAGINLTKIESRPLPGRTWEYMFFIDLDGHAGEKKIQRALERLKEECVSFKVLGSYPKAQPVS